MPNMEEVDHSLRKQVDGETPTLHNATFYAFDKTGIIYTGSYGTRDVLGSTPITPDSCFWIGSLTKLSTTIATMIAVEKGLVTLDEDVRRIVPELADIEVLEGFDKNGVPRLRKCTSPITLRQLITHTSGFCYDKMHDGLQKWSDFVGREIGTFAGSYAGVLHPLIFDPGQGWAYGPGMDWAGRTIEIVAKQDLETFMRTHIWTPLGMDSTTFRPWESPELEAKIVEVGHRNPDGTLIKGQVPLVLAMLRGGDPILTNESMDEILRPQLSNPSQFVEVVCGSRRAWLGQTWPEGSTGDFGLGSCINAQAFPGRRAANSANWQGMAGVHAWLDRTNGLGGVFFSQILPPGDKTITECFRACEEAVYAAALKKPSVE
ncbi:beta-lactamase family protein [Podospora didyma]|uniref:Beta-lactamase family protein n=1 Tax=Podospora didyma TaxID=330526 RepID=A0AAE0U0N5_9PEZI|nr:beta-lactamase family protein [Podospora didyma]